MPVMFHCCFMVFSQSSRFIGHAKEASAKVGQQKDRDIEKKQQSNSQWIGLRENLQETIAFPMKYGVFL